MKRKTAARVPEGRTRWRRFGLAMVPTMGAAFVLVFLIATGALAVSFSISGIPFKLSASNLSGTGFTQYATVDHVTNPTSGALLPAASTQTLAGEAYDAATVTVLNTASISDLHQTVCAPIPAPLNVLTHNKLLVTLDAGGGGTPATATGLVVDAPLLVAGSAVFTNINIGQDLGNALGGANNGSFSQHASSVSIDDLVQTAIGTTAGSFNLNGLNLKAEFADTCP
jgi:uncharacterized protein DUF6230